MAISRRCTRQFGLGWDGLATLLLSNLALLATAGVSGLWSLYRVWRVVDVGSLVSARVYNGLVALDRQPPHRGRVA